VVHNIASSGESAGTRLTSAEVADGAFECIVTLSSDSAMKTVNSAFIAMTGFLSDEALGQRRGGTTSKIVEHIEVMKSDAETVVAQCGSYHTTKVEHTIMFDDEPCACRS
jgi:hypothetical protein